MNRMTVTANGNFVYASESAGVSAFSVNATTGALTSVQLNPTISLANITGLYAEPSGEVGNFGVARGCADIEVRFPSELIVKPYTAPGTD